MMLSQPIIEVGEVASDSDSCAKFLDCILDNTDIFILNTTSKAVAQHLNCIVITHLSTANQILVFPECAPFVAAPLSIAQYPSQFHTSILSRNRAVKVEECPFCQTTSPIAIYLLIKAM